MAYIDTQKLLKIVGFELGQLFAQESPKKSTRMAKAFISTMKVENGVITYTLPYYAKYVIEGSPAHEIKVKNAKSLAVPVKEWTGTTPNPYGSKKGFPMYSKDKKFVLLGKKVNIPARPPNFFVQDTLNRNIKEVLEKAIKQSIIN
jgi:hypothetical protein